MSANSAATAPPGRKKLARGKERSDAAPGHASQNRSSPERAKEGSWPVVRLGDIARTTSGGTPRRDRPQFYGGNIPWVKSGELGDSVVFETEETITEEAIKSSNAKVFPKGTLCIALYGATVGKLGILGIDAATNQAVCAIFTPDELDTRYLYRFFESKRRELVEQGKGGAQPNISQGIIRDTKFPLPPLEEQRQIVAEIEKQFTRLEAGVTALRRMKANLKRYRAAVLKAACEGKLVATEAELQKSAGKGQNGFESGEQLLKRVLAERRQHWAGRGRYKEPATPVTANLPALPAGWAWASIDQLSSHITSGSRDWSQFYGKGNGTFILAQNVRPMRLDLSERQSVAAPQGDAETERTRVRAADLLVTIVGAKTGDICRVPNDLEDHFVCQSVALLRPVVSASAKFAELYLASQENGQAQWKRYIYGQGRPHLSFEQLRMTAIALPPLAEQTRIVAEVERRLSVVEELESVVSANLQRANGLRQAVLGSAFTGKFSTFGADER